MIRKIQENPFVVLLEEVFLNEYGYTGSLDNLHTILDKLPNDTKEETLKIYTIGKDDRKSVFIKKFHDFVDDSELFNTTYHTFMQKYVKPLFPNDKIVIQKTPNIRFSFPESAAIGKHPNDTEIIGLHCDSDFGHHHTEQNFIIPVTPMFETNSVYYEPTVKSDLPTEKYTNLVLKPTEFFQGYLNKQRHYNRINKTGKTRISYDLRVIPYSKYIEHWNDFQGTKFELGNYYIVL